MTTITIIHDISLHLVFKLQGDRKSDRGGFGFHLDLAGFFVCVSVDSRNYGHDVQLTANSAKKRHQN